MQVTSVKLERIQPGPQNGVLDTTTPSISWKVIGDEKNWFQSSYQIKIRYADSNSVLEQRETVSVDSQYVAWPGRKLRSRERFEVSVRVSGDDGIYSDWSKPVLGQVGWLIQEEKWAAEFIALKNQEISDQPRPETLFRKIVNCTGTPSLATVWSTAAGVYEIEINGQKISSDYLSPGWTTYETRILHQTYDVTAFLKEGANEIVCRVATGWYSGRLGFEGGIANIYGDKRALSLILDIEFDNGASDRIVTDETWDAGTGAITEACLYDGETYDANLEEPVWREAEVVEIQTKIIEPQSFPYITEQRRIKPKEIITTKSGKTVLDFGENIVGFVSFKNIKAPKGHKVTFKHAEVLENGEMGFRPLRLVKATDNYIFKGDPNGESWNPRFSFHGFRYCQVEDSADAIDLQNLEAIVIATNIKQIGHFDSSDPLLNQLHDNVVRSARGNFVSIPTDCPQRDERLGWTGDIAVFGPTASILFDCSAFLSSWLRDLYLEQLLDTDGKFPFSPSVVVPDVCKYGLKFWCDKVVCAIWQDCAILLPKTLYDYTADKRVLCDQYDSMVKYVDCIPKPEGKVLWDKDAKTVQLGDWLDPTAPPENPLKAMTDPHLVANAFLAHTLDFMKQVGETIQAQDLERFVELAEKCKQDFKEAYMESNGKLASETPTAYSLAICFNLYDRKEQLEWAGQKLSTLVKNNHYKISTGFAGTPFVVKALVDTGHLDDAYSMLMQKECPSWLYPVTMGATTIWERWDSMRPDGSINPGEMTSFNHYALGAVASTMHEVIGGISVLEAGYKKFAVKPQPGGGLDRCRVSHDSPYGEIVSEWTIKNKEFELQVTVPLNTEAVVTLPNGETSTVGSGKYTFKAPI